MLAKLATQKHQQAQTEMARKVCSLQLEAQKRGSLVRQRLFETSCPAPPRYHGKISQPNSNSKGLAITRHPIHHCQCGNRRVGRLSSPRGGNSFSLSLPQVVIGSHMGSWGSPLTSSNKASLTLLWYQWAATRCPPSPMQGG